MKIAVIPIPSYVLSLSIIATDITFVPFLRDFYSYFVTLSIALKRLKLQTSNMVSSWLITAQRMLDRNGKIRSKITYLL